MLSNPDSIRYACVSQGTTIVAEFNSENADLAALAAKCLEKVPQNHEIFSHTVRGKSYTFLIDDSHVYFAIYIHTMEKSEGIAFLRKVMEAYKEIAASEGVDDDLKKISSHCFQGVFSPIFHRLLASTEHIEPPLTPSERHRHNRSGSLDSIEKRTGSVPLLGGDYAIMLKKKKRRMSMDIIGKGIDEKKVDVSDDSVILQRNIGLLDPGLKAKKVWKKHVWIVLSMDLIICSILFGVWLWICRGLQCMNQSL
ncbi:phytolongin Phyl2.2-like [Impatiens glandulifera]|uniref:phytolongin Phyl2.2-like n=1 Tax=Impatiens glandulifera TaxID=253017 RepID=UPI001FB13E97|nr:phytolongin Phyl2.2-like [Impatiens glandulifera]